MEYQRRDMYRQVESGQSSGWTRAIVEPSAPPQRGAESVFAPGEMPAATAVPPQAVNNMPVPAPMPPTGQIPMPPVAPPQMAGNMPAPTPAPPTQQMPMPPVENNMPASMPARPAQPVVPPAQEAPPPPPVSEQCGFCITLAMSYVPMQKWQKLYEPEDGFSRGTIFEELDLPFIGKGDCRHD